MGRQEGHRRMTAKWNMIIDIEKCNGCYNCFISTKDEYTGNSEPGYFWSQPSHGHAWVKVTPVERGAIPMTDAAFLTTMCNHCDDAPCMKVAKDGAVMKRPDGIVIIVPEKAVSQRDIVSACPYGAAWWNDEAQVAQAWPFAAHLLDRGWARPRCVQSCSTGALQAIKVSDQEMAEIAQREGLEVRAPQLGTKPRVYYKNLYRIDKCFIGGSVEVARNGIRECLEGCQMQVRKADRTVGCVKTDSFGEFKVDRLPRNSGLYEVSIDGGVFGTRTITVDLKESVYIGSFLLNEGEDRCRT
jgi:Fe-S-cluster-containing dehydrogenase component